MSTPRMSVSAQWHAARLLPEQAVALLGVGGLLRAEGEPAELPQVAPELVRPALAPEDHLVQRVHLLRGAGLAAHAGRQRSRRGTPGRGQMTDQQVTVRRCRVGGRC